jgi:hypothetical protein
MRLAVNKWVLVAAVILSGAKGIVWGVPSLSLYIDPALNPGAYYDTTTETWVYNGGSAFTLTAFAVDKDFGSNAGDAFASTGTNAILSVALSGAPAGTTGQTQPGATLGTLSVDGNTVGGTWTYGVPPLETVLTHDGGSDLASHGEFPTWFAEYSFDFGSFGDSVFDTQPGSNPGTDTGWRKDFAVDLSNLLGSGAHFDLYTMATNKKGEVGINKFAPFSHDAEAGGEAPVPEPATLSLAAFGLLALAGSRKLFGVR